MKLRQKSPQPPRIIAFLDDRTGLGGVVVRAIGHCLLSQVRS